MSQYFTHDLISQMVVFQAFMLLILLMVYITIQDFVNPIFKP